MKKYFIIVFWKALEISYKSFFWGRDCPDTLYMITQLIKYFENTTKELI